MTRPRFITPTSTALTLIVSLMLGGVYQAAVSVVDNSGHTLTVEVVYDPGDPSVQGVAMVDQPPSGSASTDTIFSTWDPIIDKDPAIALDPYDGLPVVVWSRQVGSSFEIAMVRRLSGGWGPIDLLTSSPGSNVSPRVLVDPLERAHILWYPTGLGGAIYLQSFDVHNGHALGTVQRPLEPPNSKSLKTGTNQIGGGDDPGLIGGLTGRASETPCATNPAAAPDHGVLMACGAPAAYQLSSCQLVVGVYDNTKSAWVQSATDLSWRSLTGTSVQQIAQSLADARCN